MDDDNYHYDFTTASELEIFIARLEEIIQEWELHKKPDEEPLKKDDFKTKEWCSWTESLTFSDAEFILMRYFLKCDKLDSNEESANSAEETLSQAIQDMMVTDNDFFSPSKDSHLIARWYGLRDFLVLIPRLSTSVTSESRIKTLLSSVSIASSNVKCKVPIFIQALEPWQHYFLGVHQYGNYQTEFNMVHLKHTLLHCKFLTGLLTMFKSKIGLGMLLNPVTVSAQFTYILKGWPGNAWTQEPPDMKFFGGEVLCVSEVSCLPFGSVYESIKELHLNAVWPSLLENSVVDGENYSDLDPLQAPIWKVSISTVDNPSCLLTDYYTEFLLLVEDKHALKDLLGNSYVGKGFGASGESKMTSSFNALTESKIYAFSKAIIGQENMSKKESGRFSHGADQPISSDHMMVLLYYLFPDADNDSKSPYDANLGGDLTSRALGDGKKLESIDEKLKGMKSAPIDGLLWRLSIAMGHVIHSLGGVRAAAHFWCEFTQELRYRWENGILIQGLEFGLPNSKRCLLDQKLQLLNCCISRRRQKDEKARENQKEDEEESDDGEDEFYDCFGDELEEFKGKNSKEAPEGKPMGRLAKHGDMKLLETGEPLYVPVTQDSVPKTEDQLEEDTQVLLNLGTDALGSELRVKLLSAYLLSDMEAFKAANPGCVFADFIRWCSARDWIEDEDGELDKFGQKKGHLSSRMEIADNTWINVWQEARPIPAKWQKRLFNETREAEKVLDYLEKKNPSEFIVLLLPVVTVSVIRKLLEEAAQEEELISPDGNEILSKLVRKAERLGRTPNVPGESYKELINDISAIETHLVHLKFLKQKFSSSEKEEEGKGEKKKEEEEEQENEDSVVKEFVRSLLKNGEAEVPGGPKSEIGRKICYYFAEASKVEQLLPKPETQMAPDTWNVMSPFPVSSPHEKELILRLSTVKGPQRLHAIIKKNEWRICGAFTKNIYFPN